LQKICLNFFNCLSFAWRKRKEITMNTRTILTYAILITASLGLAACGSSKSDRAVSGGAIGAGVGAVGSTLTGGSPWTGAIIGGAAGAATGALTDEDQIDLDD
jgi:osmotically inducible lipoprotein OsmB